MKKILSLLVAAGALVSAQAQDSTHHKMHRDRDLSRWVIDVNLLGGGNNQMFTTANTSANYLNNLNTNTGDLTYKNGYTYGADAQLGYFFGKNRHWGLGVGFMYMMQQGDAILNNFHTEFQSTDFVGNTFRQLVTGNDVRENLMTTNMNIPLVLKYKNRFSKRWGFAADAGALFNVQMQNAYTTNASFDYEAIYKFVPNEGGGTTAVYDNSPTPATGDWLITKAEFLKNNPGGDMNAYFNAKRALGMNVGLDVPAKTTKGNVNYTTGSVGFMVKPSFNYFFSDKVALDLGVFYLYQPFKNANQSAYKLTDASGSYSSVLNNVSSSANQSYGVNLGVRFFLGGKKEAPLVISSIDNNAPTQCGSCDGSLAFHGLTPDKQVTISYMYNGAPATKYTTTVTHDGSVRIPNLCPGTYTGITAKMKRREATGATVTIMDPQVIISSQNPANPTAPGKCDGSITFYGLTGGRAVTVNYNMNGAAQTAYSGVVNSDNSVTISGLCEGSYTNVVAKVNNCTANAADFTLTAPVPPPPPPPAPEPVNTKVDISTPILFETNKATVHPSSYPVIEEAAEEMKANKQMKLTIDGHADTTGPEANNRVLSLKRANSVKNQLVKKGVNPKRVKTRGHGSKEPAQSNDTPEGRQQNRRAVMKETAEH